MNTRFPLVAGLAALALVACTPTVARTGADDRLPTLRFADRDVIDSLLPPAYARNAARLLYPCLLVTGPDGEASPDLAREIPSQANGGISRDGLTMTYHLRPDARWTDRAPLTADDVLFTQRAVMSSSNNFPFQVGYSNVRSMHVVDTSTLRVTMNTLYSPILHKFFAQNFCFGILPKHVFRDADHLARLSDPSAPTVAGPFIVDRWVRGERLDLRPNPGYFGGAPHLRLSVVHTSDSNTIVAQLKTGEIDAVFDATSTEAALLEHWPGLTIRTTTAPNVDELIVNCSDPLLQDRRLRRAIALAIDRAAIARNISHGYFDPARVAPAFFGWAYDASVPQPAYDPQRAAAMLDALGWHRGPDGIRHKDGKALELTLVSTTRGLEPSIDVQLQGSLARSGIATVVRTVDQSQQYDVLAHAKFQLLFISWSFQGWDSDLSPLLACDMRAPAGGNYGRFCNPRYDALNRAAYRTYDRAQRQALYRQTQRIFYEEMPQILLWGKPTIDIVPSRLHHFVDAFGDTFYNVSQWRLDERP